MLLPGISISSVTFSVGHYECYYLVFIVLQFVKMGRRCSVVGCYNSVGLHWFPHDAAIKRQWLRVIGLEEDCELPPHAGVCKLHFARDSYANLMEFELGFVKKLYLKSKAVPTLTLPTVRQRPPTLLPRQQEDIRLQPEVPELKATREIGCQTDPVIRQQACVQDESNAAPALNQSVCCNTGDLMEIPLSESSRAASAPLKRKRCDVSASDPCFHLNDCASTVNCTSTSTEVPPHKAKKYIIHEDQLLGLFKRCPVCTSCCNVDTMTIGTLLRVTQQCPRCDHYHEWFSQPMVNSIPAGNLQLCAAVLFTGSSFRQISEFLGAFNIQGLSEQSFYKLQAKLLIPTVSWQWKLEQDVLIREAVESGSVTLAGDMRADSPEHSIKYGSYSMMNLQSNKVIDIQLVQSNEAGDCGPVEKEGFVRSLNFLEERGVKVQAIVTDRHADIQKFLREERKEITHYFDPWHMGKDILKKIDELSKRRGTQDVGVWKKGVVDHLFWSASTSSSGEEAVAKWTSMANHIQNVHTHEISLFPSCVHEPLVREKARQWLKPRTAACERLTAILLAPRFVKDVEKISPLSHSSTFEAFHNMIRKVSPKSTAYSFRELLARLQIAALHYNENASRSQAAAGKRRYSVVYPKKECGDYAVRALKTKPTSLYIDKLMALLFESGVKDALPDQESSDRVPVPGPLCAYRPD